MADNVLESYTFSFGDANPASNGCSSRVWDFPTSIFATQKKRIYTSALLAGTMKPLNAISKFENYFLIRTVRFQVQLEADGYFFAQEFFAFASTASRASWYQLAIFESDFTNPTSKTIVGLRQNPIFST